MAYQNGPVSFNKRYEWTSVDNEKYYARITFEIWYTWEKIPTFTPGENVPYFLTINNPVYSSNWVRLFRIEGSEGSSIKFCIKEKNSDGNGGLMATGYLTRTHPDKYQYTLLPWAGVRLN